MYHRISNDSDTPDMTVSTKNFENQIVYLKKNFNIIPLDAMLDIYVHNTRLEKDTVAITFDDGYKDNFTVAYPILKKHKISATVFVATSYIGRDFGLSKEEIKTMRKSNITFGAHTVTHKVLAELDRESVVIEVNRSKSALEEILQEEIKYFAYPYGKFGRDFTEESMQIVKEGSYHAAFATDNGFITNKSNLFSLNRIGMRNFPLFVFKARLSGIFENRCFYILRKSLRF